MTAPLFYVSDLGGVIPGAEVLVDGPEGHHGATVRRLGAGEAVLLADGTGALLMGAVTRVGSGTFTVAAAEVTQIPAPAHRLVLVQALAKDGRDLTAVESATEVGVDQVLAWSAARSVVVWRGERAEKSLRKWQHTALAAAKQSRRATVPAVEGPVATVDLLERVAAASVAYLLHEEADQPLAGRPLPAPGEVLVIVGPEGGIDPRERDAFVRAGAVPVRLGSTVLRSSTAGPAALAVLCSQDRWR